ncbi:hypothetical protein CBR_g19020 [Chara braunii]|uniref:Uncharacterized protein n=1 Tax=Chara braunii TaxID=69332 RepID=A0A388KXD2_CHABU|nr:hypothetical protein CBR_g19020 [Chara braunii]|eukprot:GBG74613.1 hypothetical protein CBR_g19020 [Chara braunii]
MNHRQPEHEPLEHFQTPLADRLLRHQFNEERQLRYDIQQVNVPAPAVADLATYSLLCDQLTYAGVYVDVTQLPGRETTRVFIEFRSLQVAPNFVHSVATFIGDLTILPPPSRELARSFVREYAVQAARSVAKVQGRGGHRFKAHETLLRRAEDGPIAEEEEIQPRLRTAAAPRRMYNEVVLPDYIAQRAERLEDFPEEKSLRPPSSYARPAPPKAPKKTPKRKRRHPSPGAQGSRIGGGEEVVQPVHTWDLDPVPGSAATRVKETVVPSPPFPLVPDLNLDGAGPSAAAAGGGSRMGLPDPVPGSPVLAGPFRFRPPPQTTPIIDISSSSEPDSPSDRGGLHVVWRAVFFVYDSLQFANIEDRRGGGVDASRDKCGDDTGDSNRSNNNNNNNNNNSNNDDNNNINNNGGDAGGGNNNNNDNYNNNNDDGGSDNDGGGNYHGSSNNNNNNIHGSGSSRVESGVGDDINNNSDDANSVNDGGSNDHGSSGAESLSTMGVMPHAEVEGIGIDVDKRFAISPSLPPFNLVVWLRIGVG